MSALHMPYVHAMPALQIPYVHAMPALRIPFVYACTVYTLNLPAHTLHALYIL